jgi:hypothetical protein
MKFYLLPLIVLVFSQSTALQAADSRFCDGYAKTAVKQQIGNVAQSCAEKGLRWSSSYINHKAWCSGVNKSAATKEITARDNSLASCGADARKFNWNTLPDIPYVWDKLFEQMLQATKQDDVVAVQLMHANGVSINHDEGSNNGTILYHAVDNQAEKTSAYLLSQKANTKATTKSGGNALSKMIEDRNINYRMLGMLLKGGFDPNYGGKGYNDNYFPMLLAAKKNDFTAVKMMLQAGGNPNLKRDSTPLLYAVENKNMSMAKLLIESGANLNLSGKASACSPLGKAYKSGSRSMIEFLESKGAKPSSGC